MLLLKIYIYSLITIKFVVGHIYRLGSSIQYFKPIFCILKRFLRHKLFSTMEVFNPNFLLTQISTKFSRNADKNVCKHGKHDLADNQWMASTQHGVNQFKLKRRLYLTIYRR